MSVRDLPTKLAGGVQVVATSAALPTGVAEGSLRYVADTDKLYQYSGAAWTVVGDTSGYVVGPASSTDNALARWDGATGELVQNSVVALSDAGALTGVASLNGTTSTQLSYVDATSSIQGQLNARWNGTTSAKSADYEITLVDGVGVVLMTTGATNRTVTLPAAANSTNRVITVKKADTGSGSLILDGSGAELIDGAATQSIGYENGFLTVVSDGTKWLVVSSDQRPPSVNGGSINTGTWTIDGSLGNNFRATATGDFTITPSNFRVGQVAYVSISASGANRIITMSRSAAYVEGGASNTVTITTGNRALFRILHLGESFPIITYVNGIA